MAIFSDLKQFHTICIYYNTTLSLLMLLLFEFTLPEIEQEINMKINRFEKKRRYTSVPYKRLFRS